MQVRKICLASIAAGSAMAIASAAQAALVGGAPSTTAVTLATGNWPAGANYTSLDTATTFASATSNQGNPGAAGAGTMTVLAETFTPGSSTTYGAPNNSGFTLGKIDVLAAGGNTGVVDSIHLYALSTAPSVNASASYNDGQGHNVGPDLLGGGSGLTFPWNPGAASSGQAFLTQFVLSGTDNVALSSGTTYALEIWSPNSTGTPNTNNFVWYRNGGSPADPGGQMFAAQNSDLTDATNGVRKTINQEGLAGGAPRIASLALYPVPEPASLAMFGVAAAGMIGRRRKH